MPSVRDDCASVLSPKHPNIATATRLNISPRPASPPATVVNYLSSPIQPYESSWTSLEGRAVIRYTATTYVACDSPLNVSRACRSMKDERALVSMILGMVIERSDTRATCQTRGHDVWQRCARLQRTSITGKEHTEARKLGQQGHLSARTPAAGFKAISSCLLPDSRREA